VNQSEINRIDRITESVYYLLKGQVPKTIICEKDANDEIKQLSEMMNDLIGQFGEIKQSIVPLAKGNLNVRMPKNNFLASPFKQLHSSLNHLTWQTQQIANGDFNQQVDFMGDFSIAFNTMTNALKESQDQLLFEIEKFKQLAELKNNYLNIMAHDIRTPIGAVLGFSDILLENEHSDQTRDYLKTIRRNCLYLLNLINNILDMAKLEKQKMTLESVSFSLKSLGTDIGKLIAPKLSKNTTYIFELDDNLPKKLVGDPNRLRQVIINLLGNAAKFTESGSISFIIKQLSVNENTYQIRFLVKDSGVGIAEENLSKLFQPFSQENSGIASKFGGTGLGLAISKEIIELMGGTIHVESTLGQGTTFYFDIGLKKSEAIIEKQTNFNHAHILVVDDNPYTLEIISHQLDKMQIRFSVCNDSSRVLSILNNNVQNNTPFTLALLDLDMPELNGFELAKAIRNHPVLKNMRLVAFTNHTGSLTQNDTPNLFSMFVSKPVSDQTLQRIINEANYSFDGGKGFCSLINKRILIVDDNSVNRLIVKKLLEKQDMIIDEAENGRISIQKVNEHPYDFVLMDQFMPEMNGVQSIEEIRKNPDLNNLKILAYTANSDEVDLFLQKGANGIVSKPVDNENLINELCR
jgi:signal transduction histidine kinase/DNA-binding response OmpR family regulator